MNEFSTQLRDTIEALSAPPVPLGAICERGSQQRNRRHRRSLSLVYAAIILICSTAAVAFGAQLLHNLAITLNPSGKVTIITYTLTCQPRRVTQDLVYYVSSLASYRLVLPTGLPAHAKFSLMCSAGPDALMLSYDYPRNGLSKGHFTVLIAPPAQIAISRSVLASGVTMKTTEGSVQHWFVGQEEVLVFGSTLTSAQMERVERMMKSAAQ